MRICSVYAALPKYWFIGKSRSYAITRADVCIDAMNLHKHCLDTCWLLFLSHWAKPHAPNYLPTRWPSMVVVMVIDGRGAVHRIRANGVQGSMRRVTLQRLRRSGNKNPVIGKFAKKSSCVWFNVLKHKLPMRLRFAISVSYTHLTLPTTPYV